MSWGYESLSKEECEAIKMMLDLRIEEITKETI